MVHHHVQLKGILNNFFSFNQRVWINFENSIVGPEPVYHKLSEDAYKLYKFDEKYKLTYGGILPKFQLAYETWGKLNKEKNNAILIFTGLSANSHAKSSKVILYYSEICC